MATAAMVLDTEGFTQKLLEPFKNISLVPDTLVNNGLGVRLMLMRDGQKYDGTFVSRHAFPVLNLEEAGIEVDRREDTILAKTKELLSKHKFILQPHFDVLLGLAISEDVGMELLFKTARLELKTTHPLFHSAGFNPENELKKAYGSQPQVEFSILKEGDAIPGLDLSQPIEGPILDVLGFFVPFEQVTPPHKKITLDVARFLNSYFHFGLKTDIYKAGLMANRLWFRLFVKKKMEKELALHEEYLHKAFEQAQKSLESDVA